MSAIIDGTNGLTAQGTEIFGDGTALGGATNPIVSMAKGANNYVQSYIVNNTNNTSSSADFVAYPSNGNDSHGWVDMGITSLSYADTVYTVTGPNEAYLFGSGPTGTTGTGNLVLATDSTGTANAIQFYTGGFTQAKSAAKMVITSAGTVGVGTATPHTGSLYWSGFSAIEMYANWGSFSSSGNGPYITANAYWDGAVGWKSSNGTKQPAQMLIGNGGYTILSANSIPATDALVNFTGILGGAYNSTTTLQGGISSTGTGIAFPATQSASSDANTLDDYEEGSWTPNISSNNGTGTFTTKVGTYVKIGKQVTIWYLVDGGNSLAAGTTQYLTNIPFNVGSIQTNTIVGLIGTNGPTLSVNNLMTLSGNRSVLFVYNGGTQQQQTITFASGTATYWID